MSMTTKDTEAQAAHRHVIEDLASELDCDTELVADVYWNELKKLEGNASVHEFVPVFAARHTRDRLRSRSRRR